MKFAFKQHLPLSKANKAKLTTVNEIIEGYVARGLRLTLRQIYYQLVTKNIIPNDDKEYAKLSELLVKGRMCGIVDWDAIVDRNRTPKLPYYYDNAQDALVDAGKNYRIDRQIGQENYVELWVEKDALSEILWNKSSEYHVNLMVNRGYTSCTAVYQSFMRFKQMMREGKKAHILYVGDHDPSGLDMVRDINDRLVEMGTEGVEVRQIALNMQQIQEHQPPPNPAKIKDPRAGWYIKNFGETSWEVDALTPEILYETIDNNLKSLIDLDKYQAQLNLEKQEKAKLIMVPPLITDFRAYRDSLTSEVEAMENEESSLSFAEQIELNVKRQHLQNLMETVRNFENF